VVGTIFAMVVCIVDAQEPTVSPAPSVSDTQHTSVSDTEEGSTTEDATQGETTEEESAKQVDFASPNGKFAFLIGHGEDERTIDLIDKKTRKVLQHIDDMDMGNVTYRVLWAPDSKRFALMTRAGHPNQDVMVFLLNAKKFQKIKIPELTAEIPARIKAGKEHPHVAANNWQEAEKWNKDGSLLLTIDNTIDGAGHTAGAERTVLLGFDKSNKPKILKSTVKYESRNDDE
jgi:hypothetical protein